MENAVNDRDLPPVNKKRKIETVKDQGNKKAHDKGTDKHEEQGKEDMFTGCSVFILEAGIGKARSNLFKKQIKKFGGEIIEKFHDRACKPSHVIVDEKLDFERVCRILRINSPYVEFSDLFIVKSIWLSSCLKEKRRLPLEEQFCLMEEKIIENNPKENTDGNGKWVKELHTTNVRANTHNNAISSDYDSSADEGEKSSDMPSTTTGPKKSLPKGSWACAKASSQLQVNHNKDVTDKLEALAKIYENTNDRWRALGYSKAISALKRYPKKITSFEEAKSLVGVGEKLAAKIWEIIESGGLRKLDEISSSSEIQAINLFTNIWGVGAATARQFVSQGLRSLDDVKSRANLNRQQKIGLKYYDELLDRIPRDEAQEIESTVKNAAKQINSGLICQACGSFRRGKATCGDVDVLITHPDGKSHVGVFSKILNMLHESGFLTDDLVRQEEEGTQKKYLGVCKLPGENKKHRRLDIIVVPYSEYACALMYFTGSAHFNRSMRHLAGKMNMSLSEHSLNTGVVRQRGEKINEGVPLNTPTEESVFKHLGLPYRPPEERNH